MSEGLPTPREGPSFGFPNSWGLPVILGTPGLWLPHSSLTSLCAPPLPVRTLVLGFRAQLQHGLL